MKNMLVKGIIALVMALMVAMAVPSILPGETSMNTIEAAQMKINAKKATLIKGQSGKLKIKNATSTVKWKSSNSDVATVNKNGKVTAKKKGTATITGKVDGQTFTCKITVENPKISQTSLSLTKGDTAKLKITGTTQTITWSSSDKSVAQVNKNGKVTAKKKGNATITASVGGKKYKCSVKVKASSSSSSSSSAPNVNVVYIPNSSSVISSISFKITNNGSKTIKVANSLYVFDFAEAYSNGKSSSYLNSLPASGLPLPFGDKFHDTKTSIGPGQTKTVTFTDDTYSFRIGSLTTYRLFFYNDAGKQYNYKFKLRTNTGSF